MMRPNFVLERETLKPKNVGVTLARFASYFRKYWYAIVVVAIFMIIGTWVQVTAAEIPGQAVDCYVFQHVHRLSLNYYAEHEAGDIMSRFTNDSETIQLVLNFALIQVLSSILLIGWIVVKMLQSNLTYALLSLAMVPVMVVATVYFS